jgi:hypothetical protein
VGKTLSSTNFNVLVMRPIGVPATSEHHCSDAAVVGFPPYNWQKLV